MAGAVPDETDIPSQVEELIRLGDEAAAKQVAAEWVNRCKASGSEAETVMALKTFGQARAANGEMEEAVGPVKEALALCKDLSDAQGEADCLAALAKLYLDLDATGESMQYAEQARKIYKEHQMIAGVGQMLHLEAMAQKEEGDPVSTLRLAEESSKALVQGGDIWTEVESMILQAQMKLEISSQAAGSFRGDVPLPTLNMAQAALQCCRARRPGDQACEAEALHTLAQVNLAMGSNAWSSQHAKEASRLFRRTHNPRKRGRAMLINATATAREGEWKDALKLCEKATAILDEAGDEAGREQAFAILDEIDDVRRATMGLPSLADEAATRQKQIQDKKDKEDQEKYNQQMMMMMAMMAAQGGRGGGGGMKMPTNMPAAKAAPAPQAAAPPPAPGAPVVKSSGALQVTAGMDASIISAKILDIAKQIIGDEDDIEVDMPLMQAGLTSNTAVLLRDEMAKDLPGVNLPPTLMFDYPSIAAIADFVVEKAAG